MIYINILDATETSGDHINKILSLWDRELRNQFVVIFSEATGE